MAEIDADYIAVGVDAPDADGVIRLLAGLLCRKGAVDQNYADATIRRERDHPTGLPTAPIYIAFPHADSAGVNRSSLAVATLQKPVAFKNMADPDESLPVEIVFMLANKNPEEQVQVLMNLSTLFGQPERLAEIRALSTPAEIAHWLQQEINLQN